MDNEEEKNVDVESLRNLIKRLNNEMSSYIEEESLEPEVEAQDAMNKLMTKALGENYGIAYGKGDYYDSNRNPLGDTWYKDLAMTVLQPINLAIVSAITIAAGAIGMALSILFTPFSEDARVGFAMSAATTAIGIGVGLLAAIAPIARTYNLATRVYATVTDDITEEQVDKLNVDTVQQIKDALPTPKEANATEKYKSALDSIDEDDDATHEEDEGLSFHKEPKG